MKKTLRVFFRSPDTLLWVWGALMAAGLLVFHFSGRDLPKLGARQETALVFVQWWQEDLAPETLEKLIAEYEGQNPSVRISLEYKSRGEVREILAAIEAGESEAGDEGAGADIFALEPHWIYGLEEAGILARSGAEDPGSPLITFINPLFYNIDLLQSSGFDRPPKTREEMLSYARRISGNGSHGAAFALAEEDPYSVSRHLLSWIWTSGLNPEAGERFTFTAKPVVDTLAFLNQLKTSLHPRPFLMTEKIRRKLFAEGKIGMMIGSISEIKELREKMGDSFNITTVPVPQTYVGKPYFVLSGWFLGVNEKTEGAEKKEAAAGFAEFLKEKSGSLAAAAFAVPGSGERNLELVKADPYYSKALDMSDAGELLGESYGGVNPVLSLELNGIIREEVKRMFDGFQSPEETAAAIQGRWEKL
ncbi:MAG: extracellular solute-binding protein [Treponema sp.]|nr:extracellular solute-binding protein [Treponema sp.]